MDARLRTSALQDPDGKALMGTLKQSKVLFDCLAVKFHKLNLQRSDTDSPTDVQRLTCDKAVLGSQKNAKARVTSSASPILPTGMRFASASCSGLSLSMIPQKLSVRIGPGATTFTVIPYLANSNAQVLAIPMIPALLAPYAVRVGAPSAARDH